MAEVAETTTEAAAAAVTPPVEAGAPPAAEEVVDPLADFKFELAAATEEGGAPAATPDAQQRILLNWSAITGKDPDSLTDDELQEVYDAAQRYKKLPAYLRQTVQVFEEDGDEAKVKEELRLLHLYQHETDGAVAKNADGSYVYSDAQVLAEYYKGLKYSTDEVKRELEQYMRPTGEVDDDGEPIRAIDPRLIARDAEKARKFFNDEYKAGQAKFFADREGADLKQRKTAQAQRATENTQRVAFQRAVAGRNGTYTDAAGIPVSVSAPGGVAGTVKPFMETWSKGSLAEAAIKLITDKDGNVDIDRVADLAQRSPHYTEPAEIKRLQTMRRAQLGELANLGRVEKLKMPGGGARSMGVAAEEPVAQTPAEIAARNAKYKIKALIT